VCTVKNVAFKMVGTVLVAVYSDKTPTAEDHRRCVEVFRKMDPSSTRALIITDGGAPTPAQRKDFVGILQGREYWMAVCTDSVLVRGVVTAVGWFTKKTKAFSKDNLDSAFEYLEITPSLQTRVRDAARALQQELLADGLGQARGAHDP
jgi:hypothetical protein